MTNSEVDQSCYCERYWAGDGWTVNYCDNHQEEDRREQQKVEQQKELYREMMDRADNPLDPYDELELDSFEF
jgi:hypothetical protein